MVFIDRSRVRSRDHLEWRVRIFGAGAILAVAGIAAEIDWLVTAAIVVLAGGFLLRFLSNRRAQPDDDHEEEGEE